MESNMGLVDKTESHHRDYNEDNLSNVGASVVKSPKIRHHKSSAQCTQPCHPTVTSLHKRRTSYFEWLNTLASDLDIVLNDICKGSFPYSSAARPRISAPQPRRHNQRPLGEDPVLEQYMTSAAALVDDDDDDLVDDDAFADRSESESSDGEFFSLDDEQSSDAAVAGSDVDAPSPFLPAASSSPVELAPGGPGACRVRPVSPLCTLLLEERITKTHPIWYLPNIMRKDATQLLFDREEGMFLVRQASEPDKMVLSLRTGAKPNLEHFLIERASKGLKLKGCFRTFEDVTKLITHYCERQDGLPVKLHLPHIIMQAKTQQELTTLSLLGQDFWTSSISRTPAVMRTVFHTNVSSYTNSTSSHGVDAINGEQRRKPHIASTQAGSSSHFKRAPSLETFNQNIVKSSSPTVPCHSATTPARRQIGRYSTHGAITNTSPTPPDRSEYNGALTKFKEYHSSSLTNHSRERSAFQTPPMGGRSSPQGNGDIYNAGDLSDKLSDYEDAQGPCFFRPIIQSESESNAGGNTPKRRPFYKGHAVNNPGYDTDCLSEKSDYIDSNFFINLDKQRALVEARKRLISTEHVEETQTVHIKQIVPSKATRSKPVVFTFNVMPSTPMDTHVSPPTTAKSSIYIPISPPHKGPCPSSTSSQYSSPAYVEPYDSLVGKVEGATHTKPVVKVNNVLKQQPAIYSSSLEVKPPMSPQRKDEMKASTLPCVRPRYEFQKPQINMTRPVTNSILWQRRKVSAPQIDVNKVTHNVTSANTSAFLRSQSMRSLMADGTDAQDPKTRSLSGTIPEFKDRPKFKVAGPLQPVVEPVSPQDAHPVHASLSHHLHHHRSQPYISAGSGPGSPAKVATETKDVDDAKLSAVNDIVGDLEKLHRLIDDQTPPVVTLRRFPRAVSQTSLNSTQTSFSDTCTVDEFLYNVSPELTLRPIKPLTAKNLQRMSDYDNLSHKGPASRRTVVSSVGTQYCQPWDSNLLQDLVTLGSVAQQGKFPTPTQGLIDKEIMNRDSFVSRQSAVTDYSMFNESESGRAPSEYSFDMTPRADVQMQNSTNHNHTPLSDDEGMEDDQELGRARTQQDMEPVIVPSNSTGANATNQNRISLPGIKVRDYVSDLAGNRLTTFGKTVDNFICCTKEGNENNPHVVIRNVRQFMNGIKNYLVQNGEAALNEIIEQERKHLGQNEFLNIDALLEGALHKCVVKPLERHILGLFIEEYRRNGSLQYMKENIEYARTKSPYELGIKPELLPPEARSLEKIKGSLHRMQKAYSPIKKLHHLLRATSDIYTVIQEMEDSETASSTNSTVSLGADDFLPMFIYVLVQCGMVSAEIEADYMWGLLHPCILAGEGGYHLTILSSAVHVLKQLRETMESTNDSPRLPSLGDLQGFMKIIIPDEKNYSIITKILPVRPNMTTKDVCNMIAHRFRVTNPQDHGLYLLISGMGAEDRLNDTDCPQSMKENILKEGRECVFAYKRINAKFVWPVIFKR